MIYRIESRGRCSAVWKNWSSFYPNLETARSDTEYWKRRFGHHTEYRITTESGVSVLQEGRDVCCRDEA